MKLITISLFFLTLTFNLFAEETIRLYGIVNISKCLRTENGSTCTSYQSNINLVDVVLNKVTDFYWSGFRTVSVIYDDLEFVGRVYIAKSTLNTTSKVNKYDFSFSVTTIDSNSHENPYRYSGTSRLVLNDSNLPTIGIDGENVTYNSTAGEVIISPVFYMSANSDFSLVK